MCPRLATAGSVHQITSLDRRTAFAAQAADSTIHKLEQDGPGTKLALTHKFSNVQSGRRIMSETKLAMQAGGSRAARAAAAGVGHEFVATFVPSVRRQPMKLAAN